MLPALIGLGASFGQAHAAEAVNIKLDDLAVPATKSPTAAATPVTPTPDKQTKKKKEAPHEGELIAFDEKRGNCLACHVIGAGKNAGNIGPALIDLQGKFPKEKQLLAFLWDASTQNPKTIMPPYGKHRLLTEDEMKLIVEYLYTLTSAPAE